jgi:alkanesulfonate monooxygenase SsuD/methylene tetrahydromethanopterin reductase-like flavin-dependent oxidoreductase (luciferase family)
VRFAFSFPIFDHLADARLLADLAVEVEEADWDRVLVWDHVNLADYGFADGGPHVDPWIALALMAERTERIELGTMVTPVPRRRPVKLAREILTLHDLSGGRFGFGAGMGAGASESTSSARRPTDGRGGRCSTRPSRSSVPCSLVTRSTTTVIATPRCPIR